MLVAVHRVIHKPLVKQLPLDFTGDVHSVRLALGQLLLNGFHGKRGQGRHFLFLSSCHSGKHLIVNVIRINPVAFPREDAALSDVCRVPDRNAIIAVDDIGYHVVLLRQHFFVQHLIDHFSVALSFDAQGDHIAGYRVPADGSRETHKALVPGMTAAVPHEGGRTLAH